MWLENTNISIDRRRDMKTRVKYVDRFGIEIFLMKALGSAPELDYACCREVNII